MTTGGADISDEVERRLRVEFERQDRFFPPGPHTSGGRDADGNHDGPDRADGSQPLCC